jgi:hypothetical protein
VTTLTDVIVANEPFERWWSFSADHAAHRWAGPALTIGALRRIPQTTRAMIDSQDPWAYLPAEGKGQAGARVSPPGPPAHHAVIKDQFMIVEPRAGDRLAPALRPGNPAVACTAATVPRVAAAQVGRGFGG